MRSYLFFAVFTIGLTCYTGTTLAQPLTPKANGLKEFVIEDRALGEIRFYVDDQRLSDKLPLFIEINGSGGLPLCIWIKGKGFRTLSNTFNIKLKQEVVKRDYHYVILGKPATPFCDTISTNDDARHFDQHGLIAAYNFSAGYTKKLSLEWRVAATKKVISYLVNKGYWDGTKIIAYGYSEGAQVAPSLAVADKRVTHIIPVVGSGLNQFYDKIIAWRIKAIKGEITHQQAQDSIDLEMQEIKAIYRAPQDSRAIYDGHSYKRWASFGLHPPLEELKKLQIPIFMIGATADGSSPIYGLDYVQLEFIRLGKNNLTYVPCIGCDHFLNSTENGKTVNHEDEMLAKIFKWLGN